MTQVPGQALSQNSLFFIMTFHYHNIFSKTPGGVVSPSVNS